MATLSQTPQQTQAVGFKHVLVATDFSCVSERALSCALPIVRRYRSDLAIVHALPHEPREAIVVDSLPRELDRPRLEAARELTRLGQEPSLQHLDPLLWLDRGQVWDVLSDRIQNDQIDLLVLGTHGRGGLKKLALGSVTEEVLRLASCPVLSVGPLVPRPDPEKGAFDTILFATDFGSASAKAFPYALSMAQEWGAKLVLLHMIPPIPLVATGTIAYCPAPYAAEETMEWRKKMEQKGQQKLRKLIPPGTNLTAQPEFVVEQDFLPEGILDAAAKYNANLIVMGANRVSSASIAARIPWTLTHDVICRAKCPVLTIRD